MGTGWNLTALNPLIGKALVGALGAVLFVLFVFHQPWIPIEISPPETGVLVTVPSISAAIPRLDSSSSDAKPDLMAQEPTEVLLAKSVEVPNVSPEAPPFVQTAEAIPAVVQKSQPPKPTLAKPTVVYQLPEAFRIPASGEGMVWNFVIPTGVQRDLFLTGAELRPGNRALVRRMTLSYDATGNARLRDQKTPQPGFPASKGNPTDAFPVLAEWVAGSSTEPIFPEGASRIPAGADLVLTVEYAATPVSAQDPWSMSLYLSR